MEEAGYNITNKEFKKISKWAENVYNIAVIVDYFISNQPEIKECYNLAPVIKSLRDNADLLNAFLLIMYNVTWRKVWEKVPWGLRKKL